MEDQGSQSQQTVDTGLVCLVMLTRLYELPADPVALRHQFGESGKFFNITDILRAAKDIGLKARAISSDWHHLLKTRLPAVVQVQDGSFYILARIAEDKVLVQNPAVGKPQILTKEEFGKVWTGQLILLTRRAGWTHSENLIFPGLFHRL